jgi:formate dehydrogenase-N gamma subunit
MGRILHPFFGVLIFVVLMFMFVRFVHHNIPDKQDIPWLKGIVEVLKGNEHKVAKVGKYNAGQKMMFWTIMSMIFVLLVTGVIIWRPYFATISRFRWSLRAADPRHLGHYSDPRHPDPYVYGVLGERVD